MLYLEHEAHLNKKEKALIVKLVEETGRHNLNEFNTNYG